MVYMMWSVLYEGEWFICRLEVYMKRKGSKDDGGFMREEGDYML